MTMFARLSSVSRVGWMSLAMACGGLASSHETSTEPEGVGLNGPADGMTTEAAESSSSVTIRDAAGHLLELKLSEGTRSEDGVTTHLRLGAWQRTLDLTRRHAGSLDAVSVEENGEPLATATFGAVQGAASQPLRVFDRQGSAVEPSALAEVDPVAAALLTPAAWQTFDTRFSALSDSSTELAGSNLDAAGQTETEETPLLGSATQALSIGTGTVGTVGGGLNAWGCWSSCCESTCTAGHYEPDCCGRWIWVCDSRTCTDPCERCIWPY